MKAKLFLLTCLTAAFLLPQNAFSHEEPAKTLAEKKLKDKKRTEIKNQKITSSVLRKYTVTDGVKSSNFNILLASYYDTTGCMHAIEEYGSNDSVSAYGKLIYDEQLNLIDDHDKDAEDKTIAHTIYSYLENGLISGVYDFDEGNHPASYAKYSYNYKKNLIIFTKFNGSGQIEYTIEYTYDAHPDKGNCYSIKKMDASGKLQMKVENVFDKKGLRLQKKIYTTSDTPDYYFTYTYNINGDFSVIEKYSGSGTLLSTDTYLYDDAGNLSSVSASDAQGKLLAYYEYVYTFAK